MESLATLLEFRVVDRLEIVSLGRASAELADTPLNEWSQSLPGLVAERLDPSRNGHWPDWLAALSSLPEPVEGLLDVRDGMVCVGAPLADPHASASLQNGLSALLPWRKGPFCVGGIPIDAEWRSNLKWDRFANALGPVAGQRILDVGCGNGYYAMRLSHLGARHVLGVDPTLTAVVQFSAVHRFAGDANVQVLPLGIETLPRGVSAFDTVLSLGVLYHRREPVDHLSHLFELTRPGGKIILETIVIEGDDHAVLVPEGRYARMRNVWAVPSAQTAGRWLREVGFIDVVVVDECETDLNEQRTTDWMPFQSLEECLDGDDQRKTVEGHPRPRRAVLAARRP